MKFFGRLLFTIFIFAAIQGCTSVEAYQKMYLNDRDMELSDPGVVKFELDIQSYREGASGGNSGRTGGGCGCN